MASASDPDAVYKAPDNTIYKFVNGILSSLSRNMIGLHEFLPCEEEELPDCCEVINLENNGFKKISQHKWSKFTPKKVSENSFVDVEENEHFKLAPSTSDFVKETHRSVREWNKWVPTSEGAKRFKNTVERIEQRLQEDNDEATFARGECCNDFSNPI